MKYAVLVLLMNQGVIDTPDEYKVEFTTDYIESGYTVEQCMLMAAEINAATPVKEGNITAACMPQIYEVPKG
jgi:hypothetical protein